MKLKKILPTRSPLGWLIAAGVVAIATSPEARKTIRRLAVKGTAAVLGLTDEIRNKVGDLKMPGQQEKHEFDFGSFASTEVKHPEQKHPNAVNGEPTETEKPAIKHKSTFHRTAGWRSNKTGRMNHFKRKNQTGKKTKVKGEFRDERNDPRGLFLGGCSHRGRYPTIRHGCFSQGEVE
ncbi:hypothetical protein [Lihuaxuella thermophila]|uniref:hypothetical protein n=1 Tax=Lihuaxuella thermophila TaxID=1173111 RepID=UPI000B002476|nr:hypothetical protein [Lihuaxuella thermophila]